MKKSKRKIEYTQKQVNVTLCQTDNHAEKIIQYLEHSTLHTLNGIYSNDKKKIQRNLRLSSLSLVSSDIGVILELCCTML